MIRKFFLFSSYLLFAVGLILLAYTDYLFFNPQYTISSETWLLPKEINMWDKDIICSQSQPTPLFLNYYGNSIENWIALMWGRKIEVARTFIFPKRTTGKNYVTYAKINGELKNIALLDSIETKIYLDNFKFTKDEERFFNNCVQNVYTPKTAL